MSGGDAPPSPGNADRDVQSDKEDDDVRDIGSDQDIDNINSFDTKSIKSIAEAKKNKKVNENIVKSAKSLNDKSGSASDPRDKDKLDKKPDSDLQVDGKSLGDSHNLTANTKRQGIADSERQKDASNKVVKQDVLDKDNTTIIDKAAQDSETNETRTSPRSPTQDAGNYSDGDFESSVADPDEDKPVIIDEDKNGLGSNNPDDIEHASAKIPALIKVEDVERKVDNSVAEPSSNSQVKPNIEIKVKDGENETENITSSLHRTSTYIKPEPSIISKAQTSKNVETTKNVSGKETSNNPNISKEHTGETAITKDKSGNDKKDKMSYDPNHRSSYGGNKQAWPGDESESRNTIEDVASNFMLRVQRTEDENGRLLDDNQRLLGKLKIGDENEEKLVNEIHILKSEQADLTREYQKAKDENLVLLRRIGDMNREKEAQRNVYVEENTYLRTEIKILEEGDVRMKQAMDDMTANMTELKAQTVEQEEAMKSMHEEISGLHKRQIAKNEEELKQLGGVVEQKDKRISNLQKKVDDLEKDTKRAKTVEQELKTLQDKLNEKDKELNTKEEYIISSDKEKSMLCDELSKLRASVKEKSKDIDDLRKKKEHFSSTKKSLEKTISSLTLENEKLKAKEALEPDRDEAMEKSDAEIKDLKAKLQIMKTTERAMSDLLMSKQNHIADLRNENAELRNTSKMFKQDVDEMRGQLTDRSVVTDKYADMVGNHKKILDENKRLKNIMATKAIHETNAVTERSELNQEVEKLEMKLKKAQKRIVQLESWMDDIYSGQEYEMVPKNGISRGSILSLPEIPDTSRSKKITGRRTTRKNGPPVQKFDTLSLGDLTR